MKQASAIVTALMLAATPALAQGSHARKVGSQGAAGLGGNGTTTSASSSPTMKTGAQRSSTGGAPTR